MDSSYGFSHASPVKRKVLGDINNTADSPISPTANLKLLTKVASQYDSIENRHIPFPSHYPVKAFTRTPPKPKLVKCEPQNLNPNPQIKGVRKFKSLGFLCDKFLKIYPLDTPDCNNSQILLSDLANRLGVEKRRVYDIINVVESLQMATKIGKNSYSWTGHKKLADTLSQLKAWGKQVGLGQYVRLQQLNRQLYLKLHPGEMESLEKSMFTENANIASFFRNERRIGILCQKFVMLFLVSLKDGLVNLDLAAQVLVGEDCQQNKTRLRRLYDIANILVSLGIITKLDQGGPWKKPVFQYVGPPLHHLDDISNESSILRNLVKAELSDGVCSDLSEDSCEVTWKTEESFTSLSALGSDHSYSLDPTKAVEKPAVVFGPPAKKRLVFSADSAHKELLSNEESQSVSQDDMFCTQVTCSLQEEEITSTDHQVLDQCSIQCSPLQGIQDRSSTPVTVSTTVEKSTPTFLQVLGQGSVPQPITNGGLYRAVRMGNSIQLIRIDSS